MKNKIDKRMRHLVIKRQFNEAATIIQARWRGYRQYKKFNNWKRRYISLIKLLQMKFRTRELRKQKAISNIVNCLKKLVQIRKQERLAGTKKRFLKEALAIYTNKIKPKKPIFTTKRRSKTYGSGPYDLRNVYTREIEERPKLNTNMVLFQNPKTPIDPIIKGLPDYEIALDNSSSDMNLSNVSDTSLPSHISEIDKAEEFDVKEFVRTVRNKYRMFNYEDLEEKEETSKEDPTQFPLYVRLNKLRKIREANAKRIVKTFSTDCLKIKNDKFDKYTTKMINENLGMSHSENYEGVYFKTNDDYVKFMMSKYTTRVETIDVDSLYQKLGATYPRYKRDTSTKLIKSLRISNDEYKGFEKYLLINKARDYQDKEIDLFEFVVESRLRNAVKMIPLNPRTTQEKTETHRNLTWKQLTALKQSVAYFLQTHAHRLINDKNYDVKDYTEPDPRVKYEPHAETFFKDNQRKTYSLIHKLKDVVNILRNIYPESQLKSELETIYEGYFATLRHKAPPNSKQESRTIKTASKKSSCSSKK